MAGFRESCRAVVENPEETTSFGAQVFRIPKQDFRRALLRDLQRWAVDARLNVPGMENCLRVQKDLGCVPADLRLDGMIEQL
jgi:hypothetical protein